MTEGFEIAARAVEVTGVALLIAGLLFFLVQFVQGLLARDREGAYQRFRRGIGRTLLLTLEFLVAADIITTIAVDPSFESLGMLGLLVAIRTFLSFSLEAELEGRWPWQGWREKAAE